LELTEIIFGKDVARLSVLERNRVMVALKEDIVESIAKLCGAIDVHREWETAVCQRT
jgi:hypothetical protein